MMFISVLHTIKIIGSDTLRFLLPPSEVLCLSNQFAANFVKILQEIKK